MRHLRTKRLINEVLRIGASGLVVSSTLIAPNAIIPAFKLVDPYLAKDPLDQEFKRLIKYMERQQLIELRPVGTNAALSVTHKGSKRLHDIQLNELSIAYQKEWDKLWRLVLFDIPKSFQTARKEFLAHLRRLNFYKLQDSVWVFPFPCEAEIVEICRAYNIERFISFSVGRIYSSQEALLLNYFSETLRNRI